MKTIFVVFLEIKTVWQTSVVYEDLVKQFAILTVSATPIKFVKIVCALWAAEMTQCAH